MFESLDQGTLSSVGGAGGTSQYDALLAQDAALRSLHNGEWKPRGAGGDMFVRRMDSLLHPSAAFERCVDVDVAVCGGTLGILIACALQLSGHRVAVVEAGPLRGRDQDWNTSMEELRRLVSEGVLDESELSHVAPLEFGPMRCVFGSEPGSELSLSGVLDAAVSPVALLETVRRRFEAAGGLIFEQTRLGGVRVHPDGASLALTAADAATTLHCRLVIDCMGHSSPIATQQRLAAGQTPDGVCVQVGSCASRPGWCERWGQSGDFFITIDDAVAAGPRGRARVQHFWQAFPTSSADADERSTYMFTYLRPGTEMPSLLETLEAYWERLPSYQGDGESVGESSSDALAGIEVRRVLFGWFPTFRSDSPLSPAFDRVLSIGDASAVQSPISFGGFCAMLRHLPRLRRGIDLALRSDCLQRDQLSLLAPYLPNLGTAWMSSAAMTARATEAPVAASSTLVNDLLEGNFNVMGSWMDRQQAVTFFRDVTRLRTLLTLLIGQTATMAPLLPSVVAELGPLELIEFGGHLSMLALYTALHSIAALQEGQAVQDDAADGTSLVGDASSDPVGGRGVVTEAQFRDACRRDSWRYGSGLDE